MIIGLTDIGQNYDRITSNVSHLFREVRPVKCICKRMSMLYMYTRIGSYDCSTISTHDCICGNSNSNVIN